MQDLATHPLMTKARENYIARYVDRACEEAGECLGASECGDFIYNRVGKIIRREAREGAAHVFNKVLRGFIAEAARFVPGASYNGYVYENALEWASNNYADASTHEEIDAVEIIERVIEQISESTEKEAA